MTTNTTRKLKRWTAETGKYNLIGWEAELILNSLTLDEPERLERGERLMLGSDWIQYQGGKAAPQPPPARPTLPELEQSRLVGGGNALGRTADGCMQI